MTPDEYSFDDWEDDHPQEECGVFGVYAPGEDVSRISYFALYALQHRGQESAGITVSNNVCLNTHKDLGLVSQVFNEEHIKRLQGHIAIGHNRYSTTGGNVKCNSQPIVVEANDGTEIALGHNGNLINSATLREELHNNGVRFESSTDSELIAHLLAQYYKGSIEDAIKQTMQRIQGAYSLVIMTPKKLIAVRDPHGIRPLCIGRLDKERKDKYVIASESCAFEPIGATYIREVIPGEMITIDERGMTATMGASFERNALCLLEHIYFARPDSRINNHVVHKLRYAMGRELAMEHPTPGAHIVVPIPDTGVPAALGYAAQSGIPYGDGVIKSRYIQRTFIQPSDQMRSLGARMKFSPLEYQISGRSIVMVDDSIVRGTTTKRLVKMMKEAGAKEVHVRISAPPVKHPCFYGIDMATEDELIASRNNIETICSHIGATSLGYISLEGMMRALEMDKNNFCRACFDKEYPIPIPTEIALSKAALEKDGFAVTESHCNVKSLAARSEFQEV